MGTYIRPSTGKNRTDYIAENDPDAIIINGLRTKADRELVTANISKRINGDFSLKPTCPCGNMTEYISIGENKTCPICEGKVKIDNKEIKSILFFKAPRYIPTLMAPNFLTMFLTVFKTKSFVTLEYLLSPKAKFTREDKSIIDALKKHKIQKGWNFFCEHTEEVIEALLTIPKFRTKQDAQDLLEYYRKFKDEIYTQYISFPSSTLMIIEETALGNYLDMNLSRAIDVAKSLMGIDSIKKKHIIEGRVGKNMVELVKFYETYFKRVYQGKKGLFRTGLMSAKGTQVMRVVITGITEPHRYDEIHAPWAPFIHLMETHIISKLLKQGFTLNNAHEFIHKSTNAYNTHMHDILNELIREAGPKGIPVLVQRFPSLTTGSMLMVYITEVIPDAGIYAARISLLICPSLNADFDGDACHFSLLLDKSMERYFSALEYHNNVLDRMRPNRLRGWLGITKPTTVNVSNWADRASLLKPDIKKEKVMMEMFG